MSNTTFKGSNSKSIIQTGEFHYILHKVLVFYVMVIVEQPRVAELGIIFFCSLCVVAWKASSVWLLCFHCILPEWIGSFILHVISLCDRNNALHVYVYDCTCISWKNRLNALHVNGYDRFMYQLYIRRWILALILQVKIPTDL